MNQAKTKGFLARYGAALVDAGYDIIPIKRGHKAPIFDDWRSIRADRALLRKWLDEGYGRNGVGIITGRVIALDLDVQDERIAKELEDWCHFNIDFAPVRIGNPPKRILVYRTDEKFPKVASRAFDNPELPDLPADKKGRVKRPRNRVEVLADGQQFVAYGIHPDINAPYEWTGESLADIPFDQLPLITSEQVSELIAEYERLAEEAGWEPMGSSPTRSLTTRVQDDDDWFAGDVEKADISDDELHELLLLVPPQSGYDAWLQIGMALYHQYDGGERGLELWHEWSEQAYPDEYDADEIDQKWSRGKLDIGNKGRAPVTARLIIKLANEHKEKLETETLAELTKALHSAQNLKELKSVTEQIKKTELDKASRAQIVGILRDRFKVVTTHTLGLRDARDMVRYENPETKNTPRWLKGWVYVTEVDKFFNLRSKQTMTQTAFNTAHARFMLTKKDVLEGRARPETTPSDVAVNIHQIPVVVGFRYMPGMDEIFTMNGVRYANTYSDRSIPTVPEKPTKADRRNIERVKAHFTHLFPDEREARIFLDKIAYLVQNPGKRPGWATLIQGVEGDGKTFFGVLLGAVMGAENVRMLNAKTVQGDFNGWAEGQQVVFVEEIRLHGHNRYDVLNQIKPLITNSVIEIHRKGVDPYNIPNMSSYILATNYRDALPLTENDSRYFVLFSRFQTKTALDAFKAANPDYYDELYGAIDESAGALRGWLLEHEFGPDFQVGNRAPESRSKRYMAMLTKSEDQEVIEEILDTSMRFDLSRSLLSATDLADEMLQSEGDVEVPYGKKMNKVLSDMGFTYLGKFKVEGRLRRFWSMEPERFIRDGDVDPELVRNWATLDL